MKYKVGDKVRIKSLDWYNENKDGGGIVVLSTHVFIPEMSEYCGTIVTIKDVFEDIDDNVVYYIEENDFDWTDEMIEGLVEDESDLIPKFGEYSDNEPLDIPTMTTNFVKEHGLPCPDGYEFRDENGNVIDVKKIVLEKKKPKYPQSYGECLKVLGIEGGRLMFNNSGITQYERDLYLKMNSLSKLLICLDAYWKIAGEEMGLGKPWEPDWRNSEQNKYVISNDYGRELNTHKIKCSHVTHILAFPTAEMRDAFYEAFKELIEECKELL